MANSSLTGSLVGAITSAQIAAGSITNVSGNSYGTYTTTAPYTIDDPDVKIKARSLELDGVDVGETLSKIQERLSILVPDPKLLAKYEALREAYEHYKILEKLCMDSDDA